jgi:RNA polymerase sigma-70 factor, ECF subfamily
MVDDLEVLYRSRLTEFRRVASALAGDVDLGAEAVQEAFARAVRKRRSFAGRGTLEAWVWRIVVNAARDARRRARPGVPAPSNSLLRGADRPDTELPLGRLTERQREVIFLHYYADLGYEEIGAALGISPGTVGATLTAARRALRRSLEEVEA